LRGVFDIHAHVRDTVDLLECVSYLAHNCSAVVWREEKSQAYTPVRRRRDVADHLSLENIRAEAIVSDAREGVLDARLK
jgi:hypothetical protein